MILRLLRIHSLIWSEKLLRNKTLIISWIKKVRCQLFHAACVFNCKSSKCEKIAIATANREQQRKNRKKKRVPLEKLARVRRRNTNNHCCKRKRKAEWKIIKNEEKMIIMQTWKRSMDGIMRLIAQRIIVKRRLTILWF